METYLRVTFHSDGGKPSEIAERLRKFGFAATQGNYDFVYDWKSAPSREEILDLCDQVGRLLSGYKVLFEIETV